MGLKKVSLMYVLGLRIVGEMKGRGKMRKKQGVGNERVKELHRMGTNKILQHPVARKRKLLQEHLKPHHQYLHQHQPIHSPIHNHTSQHPTHLHNLHSQLTNLHPIHSSSNLFSHHPRHPIRSRVIRHNHSLHGSMTPSPLTSNHNHQSLRMPVAVVEPIN